MVRPVLVCCDRDGTLIVDENDYPGTDPNWANNLRYLPGVMKGLKAMHDAGAYIYTISNQAGVALSGIDPGTERNFDNLTEEVAWEVDRRVRGDLGMAGCMIRGGFICPYVGHDYADRSLARGRKLNLSYVVEGHSEIKPDIGMIRRAATDMGYELGDLLVFVIGDRASDVQTGLNADGEGVLVRGYKTEETEGISAVEKLAERYKGRVHIVDGDFLAASELIVRRIKELSSS